MFSGRGRHVKQKLRSELTRVRSELTRAYQMIDDIKAKMDIGKIVEFEYGHIPKRRDYSQCPTLLDIVTSIKDKESKFIKYLESFSEYLSMAEKIAETAQDHTKPSWRNPWFPFLDAAATYCLIAKHRPERYLEVGSGFSTKFARQAVSDFSPKTQIISIDPVPRDEIDNICDKVIRKRLEDIPLEFFIDLTGRDMFFLDSSHRVDQGNDVAVFFCEILPSLPEGMLFGIHDIFYPDEDYPESWLDRHYGEQYMLMAYLAGGGGNDEIILPCYYISRRTYLYEPLMPLLRSPNVTRCTPWVLGQSFWMRKSTRGNVTTTPW